MTKVCNQADCSKPMKARGMCGTHYNREFHPNRHALKAGTCVVCGTETLRSTGGGRKYGFTCSLKCRRDLTFGQSCEIPEDHWARMYGATCTWTPPAPEKAAFRCGECQECGASFTEPAGYASNYCSPQCAKRMGRRRRRAREHNAPGEYRWVDVMRQYRKQGYACAYCMTACTGLPDPEHVVPLSRGGRNDTSNLVAACRGCNADKGDLTLDEWRVDRERRHLTPVRTRLTGTAYNHLMVTKTTKPAWRHVVA